MATPAQQIVVGLGLLLGFCGARVQAQAPPAAAPLRLDFTDTGRQIKLLVRHDTLGLVCELHCYEGGPFQYGRASQRDDGGVVFSHTSGKVKATTTFTPRGSDRVSMDVLIEGPLEELKRVQYVGPCMQMWHTKAFQRQNNLAEFARRCFIYTMRGQVGMLDTARGRMKGFKVDAPENNPPCTQWYVPVGATHPGDIWAFGASGDRPLHGIVGVTSRDGKWVAAIGCAHTRTLGQGWHDCIHHIPDLQKDLDEGSGRIVHKSMLYVMPNNGLKLLEAFLRDFPLPAGDVSISANGGSLKVSPRSSKGAALDLSLQVIAKDGKPSNSLGSAWAGTPGGSWVRDGASACAWAHAHADAVDVHVSLAGEAESDRVEVKLEGAGWTPQPAPDGVPAVLRRSPDGTRTAAFVWERSQAASPRTGVPAPGTPQNPPSAVRGRLYLLSGRAEALREHWKQVQEEWKNSVPYRMPLHDKGVRFAPNRETDGNETMAYGLTILPPWEDGGSLHVNFPEHFEHTDRGHGILRYSDKRANPWVIAPDGRSATYEVESPDLPRVRVRASAMAEGDRVRLSLKITNGGDKTLEHIKPLLCFWYAKLVGFSGRLSNNFDFTYVVMDGKLVKLSSILTSDPKATAKVAYVRGCAQHDSDKFAQGRGGLIDRDVDLGLVAVTAKDGQRKVIIGFTPGKSILSNAYIPCAHADPFLPTLRPGESAEATGIVVFTEGPLDNTIKELQTQGVGAAVKALKSSGK